MSTLTLTALLSAAAGAVLTGAVRATVARSMLDHPNERSSHSRSVPRGGGVAIVLVTLASIGWGAATGALTHRQAIALLGGGSSVALIGWLDDRSSLSARLRLAVQLCAALWTVAWLGGFPSLDIGTRDIPLGVAGTALAVLAIVWSTNLFNFMDGIDGIAGSEAVLVGGFGAWLLAGTSGAGLGAVAAAGAGAALGFLLWNWQPARIFMGDVGSAYLGYLFASLAIAAEAASARPALLWVLLAGVFVFDATITLFRRLRSGRWSEAHRTHAYQRAVQSGWSHAAVVLGVIVLGVVLGMLAMVTARAPRMLLPAVACAMVLLAGAYALVGRRVPFPLLARKSTGTTPDSSGVSLDA